jgi:uncharacterized protein (DUF488 family)
LHDDYAILLAVHWVRAMTLFTLGYEGHTIDKFIARLKKAGVTVVLDVRELPLSRKKGFSKTRFMEALKRAGIAYAHLAVFGCPKPIRNQYKADGSWKRYEQRFNAYLATRVEAVAALAKFSKEAEACLVCFEADFNYCHRSLVARAAAGAGGAEVVHLTTTTEITDRSVPLAA